MKELVIAILLVVFGFMIMADTSIEFKPFSIKFGSPYNALGYMLIFIGIICIKIDAEKKGARKAIDHVVNQIYNPDNKSTND